MSNWRKIEGTLFFELAARFAMEPAERMIAYQGRITMDTEEGSYRVGWLQYYTVRVFDILAGGANPVWELDGESGDTADCCEFFNGDLDGWSAEVLGVWPDAQFGDMVILDRLVVYPPFRGAEIGLLCLGTLTRLIPRELVDEVVGSLGRKELRKNKLPARVMVYFVMAMALF